MESKTLLETIFLPGDVSDALAECEHIFVPADEKELYSLCCSKMKDGRMDISYELPDNDTLIKEAELILCKNGLAVNYTEDYMRRRDGKSMSVADELPSDKPRFIDRYGYDFAQLRANTLAWLKKQSLILLPFTAGGEKHGCPGLLICPENAAFFAYALAMMQGQVNSDIIPSPYKPEAIIYLAPPFRHSHFEGRQAVVHCRAEKLHEIFAYNLYPGPSAKKGVFSILLDMGEREGWIANHASAASCSSAYGNRVNFMHEGASGGGKSEMLEPLRRRGDGRILIAQNTLSGEKQSISLKDSCTVRPVADDMVLAKRSFQSGGKLFIADGEAGWFLRVDGDTAYGSIPQYESISIHPKEPLMFFNIDAVPRATCLIWEHFPESDGRPCTNPRVIIPRTALGCSEENAPVHVDVRSFGLRMPPSSRNVPDYGVMAMVQVVPAALAWLWRLISPRGYKNPSITAEKGSVGLESEGVGSYWPFHTGRRVTQANLLLSQIEESPLTLNILIPNQHIGVWNCGFACQWLVREYLTRRGGKLTSSELIPSRCPLFGFELKELCLEGQYIPAPLLHPAMQPELGNVGYDAGALKLENFFKNTLADYLVPELDGRGREIIECCLDGGSLEDYLRLSPPMPLS